VTGAPSVPLSPERFRIKVDEGVLSDLRTRIHNTRWPDPSPGTSWEQGTDLGYRADCSATGLMALQLACAGERAGEMAGLGRHRRRHRGEAPHDFLLTTVMLYWVTETVTSSMRGYYDKRWFGDQPGPRD